MSATPRTDAVGLARFAMSDLMDHFQVSERNPLVGLDGRVALLKNLGKALGNASIFGADGRPGNLLDTLRKRYGDSIPAAAIMSACGAQLRYAAWWAVRCASPC